MCSIFADAVAKLRLANAGESNAAAGASLEAHKSCACLDSTSGMEAMLGVSRFEGLTCAPAWAM